MTPRELALLLEQLPASKPPGLDLLVRFHGTSIEISNGEDLAELLEQQSAIDEAIINLDKYVVDITAVIERCCSISPKAGSHPPLGF